MAKSIAVIDDELVIRALFGEVLSEEGYDPHLYPQDSETYRHLRRLRPAAIILDISPESPHVGAELLEHLRHDPLLRAIPIIVCVADRAHLGQHHTDLEQRGAILLKPVDLHDLLARLQRLVASPG